MMLQKKSDKINSFSVIKYITYTIKYMYMYHKNIFYAYIYADVDVYTYII